MKKLGSIILALILLLGIGICSNAEAPLADKVSVGVILHSTSDAMGGNTKWMLEYAAEAIGNVELTFVVETSSAERQLEAAENLIVAGVDGILILNVNNDMLVKLDKICGEAGVYWGQMWRYPSDPAVLEAVQASQWYIGGCYEDEYTVGYNTAVALNEAYGAKNIAVLTNNVGDSTHDARNAGFDAACAEFGLNRIAEVRGSSTPAEFTIATENLFTSVANLDAIFLTGGASGSLDGVLQAYATSGKAGTIPLACVDFVEQLPKAFANNSIQVISGGHDFDPYFGFVILVNRLAGTPLSEDALNILLPMLTVSSEQEAKDYYTYFAGEVPCYDATEIRAMIKAFNPDFTAEELQKLADNYSVSDVVARHAAYFQ